MSEIETATAQCLEQGPDCKGKVEYHLNPDRDDFKPFPRCEYHQTKRLEQAQKNLELLSDCEPAWFDPANAGEHWNEDY